MIETERLIIRRFRASDGDSLYAYLSDAETVKYEPYDVLSREEALAEAARRSEDNAFLAVCLKSGKLIGNLYFSEGEAGLFELGYVFNRAYWGKGYAFESSKALLADAFKNRLYNKCWGQERA